MKKRVYFSLLSLQALFLILVCFPSCISSTKGCLIEGKVSDKSYEGKTVYLCNPYTSAAYDSTCIKNAAFSFELDRQGQTTEVLLLKLKSAADDLFPITLPVVAEKGRIKVVLGQTVFTSGTSLNDKLQDFLLAVDHFADQAGVSGKEAEEVRKDFMNLLEASILQNKDNGVGVYIFRAYSFRLSPECRARILEKADEEFRKKIGIN